MTKRHHWLGFLALALAGCAVETGSFEEVGAMGQALIGGSTLERVQACKHKITCGSYLTNEQYHFWNDHNVAKDKQRETYLTRFREPSRSDTEYVAVLLAGQQGGNGYASDLTGQLNEYKKPFGVRTASQWASLSSESIGAQLFEPGLFPDGKTFAAAAFDARFNYGFSAGNKQEIEDAYYEWIASKFSRSKLKAIYLAGHSRGGCLALRLAKRFKANFPEKGVIVQSYDAVCHREQNEFGVVGSGEKIENPLNSKFWSWKTDFDAQFQNKEKLAVLHFASGDAVLGLFGVHGITHNSATEKVTDYGWFRQEWVDLEHPYVDYDDAVIDKGIAHLKEWLPKVSTVAPVSVYRIRHVPSGQCVYSHGGNGATANHWSCWADPAMEFALDPVGENRFRLRDYNKNQCLYGQTKQGGSVNHWQCWDDPNMVWNMEPVSDTTFRLRHEASGQCLYPHAAGSNGQSMNLWPCWADPNMVFSFETAGENWARNAVATADSSFSGYSMDRTHDGDRSTELGGDYSWANSWDTYDLPQLLEYDLGGKRSVTRVDLYTTATYAIRDFDVVAFDGTSWKTLRAVTSNTQAMRSFVFPPVIAEKIGIVARRGPDHQFNFARVNEVEIY